MTKCSADLVLQKSTSPVNHSCRVFLWCRSRLSWWNILWTRNLLLSTGLFFLLNAIVLMVQSIYHGEAYNGWIDKLGVKSPVKEVPKDVICGKCYLLHFLYTIIHLNCNHSAHWCLNNFSKDSIDCNGLCDVNSCIGIRASINKLLYACLLPNPAKTIYRSLVCGINRYAGARGLFNSSAVL